MTLSVNPWSLLYADLAGVESAASASCIPELRVLDLPGDLTVADVLGLKAVAELMAERRRGEPARPVDRRPGAESAAALLRAGADCVEIIGLGLARRKAGLGPVLIQSRRDEPPPDTARSAV